MSDSSGGEGDVLRTADFLLRLGFDGPLSTHSRSGDSEGDASKAAMIISLAVFAAALKDWRGFGWSMIVGISRSISRLVFGSFCPSVCRSEDVDCADSVNH